MAGGGRLLHADAGRHHRQHGAAGHGAEPARESAAHAVGAGGVFAHHGHPDSALGLAGRPFRHAPHVSGGNPGVRHRLAGLRSGDHAQPAGGRACAAGRRRGAADAGRSTHRAACLSARTLPGRHEFCRHSRPGRALARPHAGRLAGRNRVLALGLPRQRAGGRGRLDRRQALPAGLPRRGTQPAGRAGLRPAGAGHGAGAAVGRWPVGPGAARSRFAGRAGHGAGLPGGLLAAGRAPDASLVCPQPVPRAGAQHRSHRQPDFAPGQQFHSVPDAADAAAQPRLLPGGGGHDDAAHGTGRHADQALCHLVHHALWLPARAGHQYRLRRWHDRQLRPDQRPGAGLAAGAAVLPVRLLQLAAVHCHEHPHPARSGHGPGQQRQKPTRSACSRPSATLSSAWAA